jgi:hypothetical protein
LLAVFQPHANALKIRFRAFFYFPGKFYWYLWGGLNLINEDGERAHIRANKEVALFPAMLASSDKSLA